MGSPKLRDVRVNVGRMVAAGRGKQTLGGYNVRPLVKDDESAEQYGPGYVALGEWVESMVAAAPRTPDGSDLTDAAWQHLWATVKTAGESDPVGVGIFVASSTGLRHRQEQGIGAKVVTDDRSLNASSAALEGLI